MEHKATILIADDESAGREVLEGLLAPEGYILAFAADGEETLAKAAELLPDVILLDVMMPEVDGFEVCRRLRADAQLAQVPIIMVTTLDDRDSRLQGIEAGADDFISKPFDRAELRARVRTVTQLNRYRQLLLEQEEIRQLNQGLEQRVADRTRELSALYDVTTVASESLDLETTLKRSLERVLAAMQSDRGTIHLPHETTQTLHLATQQGISPEEMVEIDTLLTGSELAGRVIENGEPLMLYDATDDLHMPQSLRAKGIQSYIGMPMRARGQTLGVLSIFRESKQPFSTEEMDLLASISDQVGVAVENARLRQRAEQAAVMEERERLARELHDSVTQSLYSLALFAAAGKELVDSEELESLEHNFVRIGETVQEALKEMRLLVHELRPPALEREGLVGALRQRINAVEGRAGIDARLVVEDWVELPASIEEGLYRIAQEALNNALKHSAAQSVTIYLRVAGKQVELEVVDDGAGFDPHSMRDSGGMGLLNMKQRAHKLGGELSIVSAPREGTKVKVSVRDQNTVQETS